MVVSIVLAAKEKYRGVTNGARVRCCHISGVVPALSIPEAGSLWAPFSERLEIKLPEHYY